MFKPVAVIATAALLAFVATPADAAGYQLFWGGSSCTACPNSWYFGCPSGWNRQDQGGCGFWNAGCQGQCYQYKCKPGYRGSWTSCYGCGAGKYSNQWNSGSCSTCGAGTYSNGGANTGCTSCSINFYSGGGAGSCSMCPAGKYNNAQGSSGCSHCPQGKFGVNAGEGCVNCPSGKYNYQQGCVGHSCCKTDSPTTAPTTKSPTTAPSDAPTTSPTTQEFQAYQFSKSSLAFHEWQTALVGQTMYKCHDFEGCYKNEAGNRLKWTHTSHPGVALGPEPIREVDDGEFHTADDGITFKDKVTEVEYYAPFSCNCE